MKKQILKASLAGCILALSQGVWADSFILKDVQIKGLERVSPSTILSSVPVRAGQKFDDKMTANIIGSLYKTGLFDEVNISKNNNILIVQVHERATVGNVKVSGNYAITTEALLAGLKRAGVSKGHPLNKSALKKIQHEIKQQYLSSGNYNATVKTNIVKLPRNRVTINVAINEGAVARIKRLNITGNQAYSDTVLAKLLDSGAKQSFLSDRNKYAKEKLVGDLDKLSSFYRDRGYINFKIISSNVSLSKDKRSVFVNIKLHEGTQYRTGNIKLVGNSGLSQEQLTKISPLKRGQIFSNSLLKKTQTNIRTQLGKAGYASSRVSIIPKVNKATKIVDLTFQADKGPRAYVRRINIRGNFRTKDEVFRREMRQLESSYLSAEKIKRSKARIQRLPFVKSVKINTSPVAGSNDQIDLDVIVSEQSANRFSAGVGYSGSSVIFNVGLEQNNFMGTGKSLSLAATNSKTKQSFRMSYNNPYHTVDGVGRGFNVYYDKNDTGSTTADYISNSYGADVNYTIPISEDNSLRFSIGGEHREIITSASPPTYISNFINANGDNYNNILGKASYIHDTRDRTLFPTKGVRHNLALEAGLPGGDLTYYKLKANSNSYFPVTKKVTFALKGGVSYGKGYGDTTTLPFFERFYSGGISTVRGFDSNSLGPKSGTKAIGGTLAVNARAELLFPVPFAADIDGLRMSAFVDAGNVFEDSFDADDVRYSAGLSATWMSPLGPFTLSYAKPLNAKTGDEIQKLQFSIGASF